MLVVIGMIAIVTAVALPKIKGIYEEFKINQTVEEVATLISSYRSYYLIMNEFPDDTAGESLGANTKADWCLPKSFYSNTTRKFVPKPYKGTVYDLEQWLGNLNYFNTYSTSVALSVNGLTDQTLRDRYSAKISNLYPKIHLTIHKNSILNIHFAELTADSCKNDPVNYRNQFR